MAKISVSVGETIGSGTIPELKKFESLRIDTQILELDSSELGMEVKDMQGLDNLFKQAREKLFEQQKLIIEEARTHLKDRTRDIRKK